MKAILDARRRDRSGNEPKGKANSRCKTTRSTGRVLCAIRRARAIESESIAARLKLSAEQRAAFARLNAEFEKRTAPFASRAERKLNSIRKRTTSSLPIWKRRRGPCSPPSSVKNWSRCGLPCNLPQRSRTRDGVGPKDPALAVWLLSVGTLLTGAVRSRSGMDSSNHLE